MISLSIITSLIVSLSLLILLRPLAIKFGLIDYPTERKNHVGNIPIIGGVCVFLGILISCLLFIELDKFSNLLLITSSLILLLGVWDDYINLKARTKLAFQALITLIMIYFSDVKLESLGNFFGTSYAFELHMLSVPVTLIAVIGLMNAINMIDGLDGLAASVVLIAITGLIYFDLSTLFTPLTSILLLTISALLPFIIFNLSSHMRMKIFLGDGGSLFLGYIVSWSLIYSSENINNFTHTFALWCVVIPLFDFFAVIIIRILKNHSLIIARKDHLHHFLLDLGFSKRLILFIILSYGSIFLLIGIFIENRFPTFSSLVFLILFLIYLFIRVNYSSLSIIKKF